MPPGRNRHRGFIVFFGWRAIATRDGSEPVRTRCPACHTEDVELVGVVQRQWFTLFFIPVVPIQSAASGVRLTKCKHCRQLFAIPIEQFARRAGVPGSGGGATYADAIAIYNQLRDKPDDGKLMLDLLATYDAMDELGEAESAARHYPRAMQSNPDCVTLLQKMRARLATNEGPFH